MYFHNPRRSMTNSSIDHQALLKTTHIAILTTSGNCWNDSLSIFSPFFKWPCRPLGKMLIVKAHFKSSILLGNQNENWRSCRQSWNSYLCHSLLRKGRGSSLGSPAKWAKTFCGRRGATVDPHRVRPKGWVHNRRDQATVSWFPEEYSCVGAMATASSKEVPRDGSPDFSAEEHAEALEEKHAVSLHEAGRLRPHPPVTPRKPFVKLASLRTSSRGFHCGLLLSGLLNQSMIL